MTMTRSSGGARVGAGSGQWRRRDPMSGIAGGSDERRRLDGLSGPRRWAQRAPLTGSLDFFCFFILLTEAGIQNASEKATINRDLWSEVVGLPASEKPFCPPRLLFSVVVIVSNNLVNFFLGKLPRNDILDYPHGLQRHNFDGIFLYSFRP
jgi:hypothetical protein